MVGSGVTFRSGFGIAVLGAALAGCAGKSEGDGEGSAGSSGTSGGGTGGSPRPPKLGLYLMLRNPDPNVPEVAGRTCPTSTGVEWDIGEPIVQNGIIVDVDSPTPTDFGTTLEDGTNDTQIACTVSPSGVFQIDGGGVDPQITVPNGVINFSMSGTTGLRGGTTFENFSVYTPLTLDLRTNAGFPPCTMTSVHEIAPGAIWADLDCPALTKLGESTACRASGTIVAEYCRTE